MRVKRNGDLERDQEYPQGLAGVQVWLLTSLCERSLLVGEEHASLQMVLAMSQSGGRLYHPVIVMLSRMENKWLWRLI